jgi:hypothetical protein
VNERPLHADRHANLRTYFNAYLNADWELDYDSWPDAVDHLISGDPSPARHALSSLDEVLPTVRTEADAEALLASIGFMGWTPERMGDSKLAWLRELRRELASRLGQRVDADSTVAGGD